MMTDADGPDYDAPGPDVRAEEVEGFSDAEEAERAWRAKYYY
jgi:hypothetical protein